MKLCRFELKTSPGEVRSGMVHAGRIYETDGASAVAVHEAADVRPLAPIPHAPSVRVFRTDLQPEIVRGDDAEDPLYFYANPTVLSGASTAFPYPEWCTELSVFPAVAVALVGDVPRVEFEEADDTILGYTLMLLLVARDVERRERRFSVLGRSHDIGGVMGPVLTTPDELDEEVQDAEFGRRFELEASLRVNGVERGRGTMGDFPFTFAQAIAAASLTAPLRAGDIFAFGPVAEPDEPIALDPGDQVQVAVDKLGTLTLNIANSL
ncbi:MAG: fumarylacetoacetate hydrolase family protein [Fimbriimonas sp.]